ncbi:ankyrin repeat-containing domain protein [Obelidium mucronatum]|nr:ankyrin repeat-containing domain protein [Obelidium mucronatum]
MPESHLSAASLPSEVLEAILEQLPINGGLMPMALASKCLFAPIILDSPSFARQHFHYQYDVSGLAFWEFLNDANLRDNRWLSLPNQYNLAIYKEILAAPDWNLVETIIDQSKNLMWSLRWNMPATQAYILIHTLLEDPCFDPTQNKCRAIRWACRNGHLDVVKLLIKVPSVDPSTFENTCLSYAAEFGHTEIVKLLLADPRVDPADRGSIAIRLAAQGNQVGVVKLLLKDGRADPASEDNNAIIIASDGGLFNVVKLLLADSRVDAKAQNGAPLYWAKKKKHAKVAELLEKHIRIKNLQQPKKRNVWR